MKCLFFLIRNTSWCYHKHQRCL